MSLGVELPKRSIRSLSSTSIRYNWNLVKSNTDILPTNTVILDLQRTESEILAQMKPKTRYNIGLALRKGVRVESMTVKDLGYLVSALSGNCLSQQAQYK